MAQETIVTLPMVIMRRAENERIPLYVVIIVLLRINTLNYPSNLLSCRPRFHWFFSWSRYTL